MSESTSPQVKAIAIREQLMDWFAQPLGKSLLVSEAERLRDVLPGLYATSVLQLGRIDGIDLFESCNAPRRILLDLPSDSGNSSILAMPEALPFEHDSIDMAVLPHTLDFCLDPHQVLREVGRVLMPESHVVMLGFNPFSLWGLRRKMIKTGRRQAPWRGHFISLRRMKDWLQLLQFEITHGSMMYYRPPMQKQKNLDRFRLLDRMGDRWWPMMGAVYLLVARKRVAGMTPIRPRWRLSVVPSGSGTTEPAARGIAAKHETRKRAVG